MLLNEWCGQARMFLDTKTKLSTSPESSREHQIPMMSSFRKIGKDGEIQW